MKLLRALLLKSLTSVFLAGILACATSPLGRKQLILLPEAQMDSMGAQAFDQMKAQTPVESDPKWTAYVRCVALPITRAAASQLNQNQWEIVVFKDPSANAFALPGGKIGVHTGLLKVAKTDAQLAAVLGHEVGHVIANHGNERMSEGVVTQLGMAGAETVLSTQSQYRDVALAALGIGTQVGVLLPHSRTQESEADLIGLNLMARAGFEPRQSVELWKNMMASAGGSAPPEFLSTHPASQNRITELQSHMSEAESTYAQAPKAGRCSRP